MDVASRRGRRSRALRAAVRTAVAGVLLASLGLGTSASVASTGFGDPGWRQVWSDEFSGRAGQLPSRATWLIDTGHGYPGGADQWGTGELEAATADPANVSLNGRGQLRLTARRNSAGGWTSARVETRRSDYAPPAGGSVRFSARIQLPDGGQGYWPAFWALGAPFRPGHTDWPGAGEVDVLETIDGQRTVHGTLHCGVVQSGGPCHEDTGLTGTYRLADPGGFHLYSLVWSDRNKTLTWSVDDHPYWSVSATDAGAATWTETFRHGYFLILDLAIGGDWPGAPGPATRSGAAMLVDSVSVSVRSGR